jgi:hypothetical protein
MDDALRTVLVFVAPFFVCVCVCVYAFYCAVALNDAPSISISLHTIQNNKATKKN